MLIISLQIYCLAPIGHLALMNFIDMVTFAVNHVHPFVERLISKSFFILLVSHVLLDCDRFFTTFAYFIWMVLVSVEYTFGFSPTYSVMGILAHSFFVSPVPFDF